VVLAETLDFNKGDVLEWSVKDNTTLLLRKISSGTTAESVQLKPKIKNKK